MDISNNYITMCDMAQEIQDGYKPSAGDFAVRACEYGHYTIGLVSWRYNQNNLWWSLLDGTDGITLSDNNQERYLEKLIWIPRQDQLQEVIKDCVGSARELANMFHPFINETPWNQIYPLRNSMEQLWLAFVMKEKYGKIWDNERWEVSK